MKKKSTTNQTSPPKEKIRYRLLPIGPKAKEAGMIIGRTNLLVNDLNLIYEGIEERHKNKASNSAATKKHRWTNALPPSLSMGALACLVHVSNATRRRKNQKPLQRWEFESLITKKQVAGNGNKEKEEEASSATFAKYLGGRPMKPDRLRQILANALDEGWVSFDHVALLCDEIQRFEATNMALGLFLKKNNAGNGTKPTSQEDYWRLLRDVQKFEHQIEQRSFMGGIRKMDELGIDTQSLLTQNWTIKEIIRAIKNALKKR